MTAIETPVEPKGVPVGHQGARVEIHERPARAANGWLGVAVLLRVSARPSGSPTHPVRGLSSSRS